MMHIPNIMAFYVSLVRLLIFIYSSHLNSQYTIASSLKFVQHIFHSLEDTEVSPSVYSACFQEFTVDLDELVGITHSLSAIHYELKTIDQFVISVSQSLSHLGFSSIYTNTPLPRDSTTVKHVKQIMS